MDENNADKLEEGMKWEVVDWISANSIYLIDHVSYLKSILDEYPNAVLRDGGKYGEIELGIYTQVPKTKAEYLYDAWEKIDCTISKLKISINDLHEKFTSRVKIIESDKRIPQETLDEIDAKDPDGDYILMNPRVLVKQDFDKNGWESEVSRIIEEIDRLSIKRKQLWAEYQAERKKGE